MKLCFYVYDQWLETYSVCVLCEEHIIPTSALLVNWSVIYIYRQFRSVGSCCEVALLGGRERIVWCHRVEVHCSGKYSIPH